jgi:L-malate glycosyltransferase
MRVTSVLSAYCLVPSGGFRVVYEYANRLVARGHGVSVVHQRPLPPWDTRSSAERDTFVRSSSPIVRSSLYSRAKTKAGDLYYSFFTPPARWRPCDPRVKLLHVRRVTADCIPEADAVFAVMWPDAEMVLAYPASKGAKFYLVMDLYPFTGSQESIEASWRLPLAKVAVSNWLHQQIQEAGGNNAIAIPVGVDHLPVSLRTPLSQRNPVVAMMYSQLPYKAPHDAVTALELCKQHHPGLQALVFGPLPPDIEFPGWFTYFENLTDQGVVDLYNRARVFVSSSLAEGFGLPAAEAMACGCAVVSTDNGGNREYAEHGVTALLSPPRDPVQLAENVDRLLRDDRLRVSLAEAGHRRIQQFSWERATDALEEYMVTRVARTDVWTSRR